MCPPLLYVFQDDLVNRLGVEAGLFRLHPPYAARMGWSSLLSLASQQTPMRAAGHPREQSMWPAGGEGEESHFLCVRRQTTLRPFLLLAEVTGKT